MKIEQLFDYFIWLMYHSRSDHYVNWTWRRMMQFTRQIWPKEER